MDSQERLKVVQFRTIIMAVTKQKFREILFHLLYSQDFDENEKEDIISFLMAEHEVTKKTIYAAQRKQVDVMGEKEAIDKLIAEASHAYDFARIPRIEKNILRLGVYEICFDLTIPPKVAIAEAIRLARKFSTPESSTFVNAILDAIYKKVETNT